MSAERRRRFPLLAFWLVLLAVVVWNGVFDSLVAEATRQYVKVRDADPSLRPARVDLAMQEAVRASAWEATAITAPLVGIVALGGAWRSRRRNAERGLRK